MGINLEAFFEHTKHSVLEQFHSQLRQALDQHYHQKIHGRSIEWDAALNAMPQLDKTEFTFNDKSVTISKPDSLNLDHCAYKQHLKAFMPWRKGPWNLLGVEIDTE